MFIFTATSTFTICFMMYKKLKFHSNGSNEDLRLDFNIDPNHEFRTKHSSSILRTHFKLHNQLMQEIKQIKHQQL